MDTALWQFVHVFTRFAQDLIQVLVWDGVLVVVNALLSFQAFIQPAVIEPGSIMADSTAAAKGACFSALLIRFLFHFIRSPDMIILCNRCLAVFDG